MTVLSHGRQPGVKENSSDIHWRYYVCITVSAPTERVAMQHSRDFHLSSVAQKGLCLSFI